MSLSKESAGKEVLRKHVYNEGLTGINIMYRSLLNACDQLIELHWDIITMFKIWFVWRIYARRYNFHFHGFNLPNPGRAPIMAIKKDMDIKNNLKL